MATVHEPVHFINSIEFLEITLTYSKCLT